VHEANDRLCVLVQAETRTAIDNLEAIAAVDGVDGIFIGPADLSASMGHRGEPGHPEMLALFEAPRAASSPPARPPAPWRWTRPGAPLPAVGRQLRRRGPGHRQPGARDHAPGQGLQEQA
jgi:hypothetical protein